MLWLLQVTHYIDEGIWSLSLPLSGGEEIGLKNPSVFYGKEGNMID
jgi:hypothetical protein